MKSGVLNCAAALSLTLGAPASPQAARPDSSPIYRVTVVSRTLPAINYGHRTAPTSIDFRGTVLLPMAKGDATVEGLRGRVSIQAKFSHLDPPTQYGREYLTYVLWAITPEGRPKNLGEVIVSGSNRAKIAVTTDLQAFGLMVTAEPYYSVTTPSDVVVLENVVRPDTIGKIEQVAAKYELMPRGQYTMTREASHSDAEAQKLPYDRYEALLEVYQAQNAVQIAKSAGAERYAAGTLGKAEALFEEARQLQAAKGDPRRIVSTAREAAQMAEDARVISAAQHDQERASREARQEQEESRARAQAEAETARARAQAEEARAVAESERASAEAARREAGEARARAERNAAEAEAERSRATEAEADRMRIRSDEARQQARAQLLAQFNGVLAARDTPRGLVVTVPGPDFESHQDRLRAAAEEKVARIAATLAAHPGLMVHIEGYTDDRGNEQETQRISRRRAEAVREALVAGGLAPGSIAAAGYGKSNPVASNTTGGGREQNQRVEIVVTGEAIGARAVWDHPYALSSAR